ncbi:Porin [Morganella morganii]
MPNIHCMSNGDTPKPDTYTAVNMIFTYIFVNRDNWNKRRHIEAKNDISAQNIVGSDYIFAARFRWAV